MHERHIELTSDMYQKEKQEAISTINKSFEIPLKEANKKYAELVKKYGDDIEGDQLAYHYSGLDSIENEHSRNDWEIKEEFTDMSEQFNNLALMQIHSFFEKEITDLCKILKLEFNEVISLDDFSSKDYVKGPLKYLELVVKLNIKKLEPFTNKFRDIQYLRNRIVHERGEFPKNSSSPEDKRKTIEGIVASSKKRLILSEEDDFYVIKINEVSYIKDHYQVIKQFFQEVFNLIEEKLNYRILKGRLEYVFSALTKKAIISIDKVVFEASRFDIRFSIKFPKSLGLGRQLKCHLKINKFKKTPVYIKYTGVKNAKIEEFVNNLKSIQYVLLDMLNAYFLLDNKIQVELFLEA